MVTATVVSYLLQEIHRLPGGLVYGLVAVLVFGEAALFIGFVLPGETSVLVAGVAASQGRVNVGLLCVVVVAAAIVGDSVGYAVGRYLGPRLAHLPLIRSRPAELESAYAALRRRGATYVVIGRFTAFLRAVMPGLAGASRMRYRRFLVANAIGGLVWGVGYTLLGYFAGTALSRIENIASWLGAGVLLVVLALLVGGHLVRRRRRARARTAAESGEQLP